MPIWKDCYEKKTLERCVYFNIADDCEYPIKDTLLETHHVAYPDGTLFDMSEGLFLDNFWFGTDAELTEILIQQKTLMIERATAEVEMLKVASAISKETPSTH